MSQIHRAEHFYCMADADDPRPGIAAGRLIGGTGGNGRDPEAGDVFVIPGKTGTERWAVESVERPYAEHHPEMAHLWVVFLVPAPPVQLRLVA